MEISQKDLKNELSVHVELILFFVYDLHFDTLSVITDKLLLQVIEFAITYHSIFQQFQTVSEMEVFRAFVNYVCCIPPTLLKLSFYLSVPFQESF